MLSCFESMADMQDRPLLPAYLPQPAGAVVVNTGDVRLGLNRGGRYGRSALTIEAVG